MAYEDSKKGVILHRNLSNAPSPVFLTKLKFSAFHLKIHQTEEKWKRSIKKSSQNNN